MKWIIVLLSFLLLAVGFYFFQPLLGLNISITELLPELFSKAVPSFKTSQPFQITVYAKGFQKPRFLTVTQTGDLLVTDPPRGEIIIIPFNHPEKKEVLLKGLHNPHSTAIYQNKLYVAEEDAVGNVPFHEETGKILGDYQRIIKNIPKEGGHWTRTLKFGPDGYGYLSIGSSCNACIEKNPFRATISRFKPGDNQLKIYATGLRNAVGFDWSPLTGIMYATENGRDFLGDTIPPEELNQIEENAFYGWPYAYGNQVPDPKFGKGNAQQIAQSKKPVFQFEAHSAPLGLTFIKDKKSPFYNQALVALHGSWNRSKKVGYQILILHFEQGKIRAENFLSGFLNQGKVKGRPVHIVEGKKGKWYLSDDMNGIIYLITQ